MAYDKSTDLNDIQKDVLTTAVTSNSKINKLNQLSTTAKTVIKAINELNGLLGAATDQANNATEAASEANKAVETTKAELQETIKTVVKEVITTEGGSAGGGGSIQNDEFSCEDDQVKFILSKTPADKDNILFYVNGVKYTRADFQYNEADNSVEWVNVAADEKHPHPFHLKAIDVVSVVYTA